MSSWRVPVSQAPLMHGGDARRSENSPGSVQTYNSEDWILSTLARCALSFAAHGEWAPPYGCCDSTTACRPLRQLAVIYWIVLVAQDPARDASAGKWVIPHERSVRDAIMFNRFSLAVPLCFLAAAMSPLLAAETILVEKALRAMDGAEEIVFAVRGLYDDGHYYANFGHWSSDPNKMMYAAGGSRLCKLNLRTKAAHRAAGRSPGRSPRPARALRRRRDPLLVPQRRHEVLPPLRDQHRRHAVCGS